MPSSGQCTDMRIINFQLQMNTLGVLRDGPINKVWMEEGFSEFYILILNYFLLQGSGKEESIAFTCISTGDSISPQWIVTIKTL